LPIANCRLPIYEIPAGLELAIGNRQLAMANSNLSERISRGEAAAVARAISKIEDGSAGAR
jgi:hypothetical protein